MSQADEFKAALEAQLGEPYVLGDEGPNSHDCSGLHYEGMRAAGVLWKGRPWPRLTAHEYKNMARPLPAAEPLKVGDPCFFLGTSGHAYHVASFVGYDETAVGWTVEARGRKWGVVKYRLNDSANGVLKRGGKFYRYPGVDLGDLTGGKDMPIEEFSALVKAEMEKAQKTLVAAGILANDTRPIDNVPTLGYVDLIAARIVDAIRSGRLSVGDGS